MAHVRAGVRCVQCVKDKNESSTYVDTQLRRRSYHPQAAYATRRAGSDAEALENDASATSHHTAVAVSLRSAVRAPLRLLLAESDCLLLAADVPSTSAEGGDVCSVRTGLYRAVFVKRYFGAHSGVQKIPPRSPSRHDCSLQRVSGTSRS